MNIKFIKSTLTIFFLMFSSNAFSYAENVIHGYVNCMSCHYSPSGGGVLNDYGRSLSGELMSAWKWKNAENPAFGIIQNSNNIKFGGDFRYIQTYYENDQVKQGKSFEMQKNIEIAANVSKLWFIGTLGTQGGPNEVKNKDHFLSERHYILWNVSDTIKVRAGKFKLNYGINDPNHTIATKQQLGFGPNSETYILEFSHFTDEDEIFISSNLGRLDLPRNKTSEKSISTNYSKYISENSKIGLSLLFGESELKRRSLLGTNGIVGFLKNNYLKYEVDLERSTTPATPTESNYLLASNVSVGRQIYKGISPYLTGEFFKQDISKQSRSVASYGTGIQLLPIPHLEIQIEYKKITTKNIVISKSDSAWVLFHFYL